VASYLDGGGPRYAVIGVSQPGPAWTAYPGRSAGDHQAAFNDLVGNQGFVPINISITSPGNVPQFAALYHRTGIGGFLAPSFITPAQYQQQWTDNNAVGRNLFYLSACQHAGGVMFSAIFASGAPGSGGQVGRHGLDLAGFQRNLITWTDAGLRTRVVAGYASGGVATFGAGWRAP
jgi:hypothetical protein